jgi:outer membrane protein assembly factor BamB
MLLVFMTASALVVQAQPELPLLWEHRFPEPTFMTGYGDVAVGMAVRNDSLLVGHSWENISQSSLIHAATGDPVWSLSSGDTVYHQGGRSFFGNAMIGAERVASGAGIGVRTRLYDLDGTVPWTVDAGLQNVARMCGPLVNGAGDSAFVLAYQNGTLHGFCYDHAGGTGSWQLPTGHPWREFSANFNAAGHLLVTAMVDHPGAFTDVPRLVVLNSVDGSVEWSAYLEDTTGFVVNSPAMTVPWAGDTMLTVHTTYAGKVLMRMTEATTGQSVWSFEDSLSLSPYLASVAVVPSQGSILVALDRGSVIAYSRSNGRVWMDTLNLTSAYPNTRILANEDHVVLVSPADRHLDQGQDVMIRALDPTTGTVLGEAWVNDIADTHDMPEDALLNGSMLHLISAATHDTLNILFESTTLLVSTFDLSVTTGVHGHAEVPAPVQGIISAGSIQDRLGTHVKHWKAFDRHGRLLATGDRGRMDAWYTTAASGMYTLVAGKERLVFLKP